MSELTEILHGLGFSKILTYIQNGKVVFRSANDPNLAAQQVASEVRQRGDFWPHMLLLEQSQFLEAIKFNPFTPPAHNPNALHFRFPDSIPTAPELDALEVLSGPIEQFSLIGKVFYLLRQKVLDVAN